MTPKGRHLAIWRALVVGVYATVVWAGAAAAQMQPPPVDTGRPDEFAGPGRGEDALPLGSWLIYPSAFLGGIYDSNVDQSPVGARAAYGLRVAPSVRGEDDEGLYKTDAYAALDAKIYPGQDVGSTGNSISAHAGAIEVYKPTTDLIFNGQLDYTRQLNSFSTLNTESSTSTLNSSGVGVAPTSSAPAYNQFTASLSGQKNFDRAFAVVSGSVVDQIYDSNSGGLAAPAPNGIIYTGTARGGFWIVPTLYGYISGSVDKRNYATSALSSTGYRTVAGVGSDQVRLLRGEIYVGYQAEDYKSGAIGTVGSWVAGARGYYYPLPELTITAAIDETLGVASLVPTAASSAGSATRVTSFLTTADYSLAQEWTASARAGYVRTAYVGTSRKDNAWTIGGGGTYSVWQNFGVTLDYQHIDLTSNVPLQGYTEEIVTLGVTYKY